MSLILFTRLFIMGWALGVLILTFRLLSLYIATKRITATAVINIALWPLLVVTPKGRKKLTGGK